MNGSYVYYPTAYSTIVKGAALYWLMRKAHPRSRVIPEAGPILKTTEAGEALFVLLRAHSLVFDAVDRALKRNTGLSLALWEVLVILSKAPGMRLPMADVTKQMLVSKSHVTQLIDKLEQAGMVTRERTDVDRRLIYATLTPAGAEAVRRGGDTFNDAAKVHFAQHFSVAERRTVMSALSKLIEARERSAAPTASSSGR